MKKLLILLAVVAFTFTTQAQTVQKRGVPATPYPIEVIQPNGDTLTIRLHGDEHYHFRTTLDNYAIMQNKKGYYCYAYYSHKGQLIVSSKKAHNEEKRTKKEIQFLLKEVPQMGKVFEVEENKNTETKKTE